MFKVYFILFFKLMQFSWLPTKLSGSIDQSIDPIMLVLIQ